VTYNRVVIFAETTYHPAMPSKSKMQVGSLGAATSPARAWSIVALLWFTFLLNYIDRQTVFSIYPSLSRELGFTSMQLGLIGSVFLWVYSLSSAVTGRLADLFRKDALVIACLAIWSVATLATGMSYSVNTFLFWRGVMGFSESLYLPASMALIAMVHSASARSTALALHQTAQMIGIILGGWGGGWMADRFGWRSSFILLAVVGIAYAPVLWAGLRKVPPPQIAVTAKRTGWLRIFRSPCYLALAAAFTAYCLMLWIFYAWFPAHLYERFHLSQAESGLTASLYPQGSTVLGVLFWGVAADWLVRRTKMGRFLVLGTGILFCAPFAYLALSLRSLFWVKIAAVGFGFFAGGLHSNISAAAFDLMPAENYGVAVGALNLIGGIGGGIAILGAGIYRNRIGVGAIMGWSAVVAALAAVCMLLVVRQFFSGEYAGMAVREASV
jgi:MFS family permease